MKNKIEALLWRKIDGTVQKIFEDPVPPSGTGGGARHVPLTSSLEIDEFLNSPQVDKSIDSHNGNIYYEVNIEPFVIKEESENYNYTVVEKQYKMDFQINPSRRNGEITIRRQTKQYGYPLWVEPSVKGIVNNFSYIDNYLFIVKLVDGSFHARFILEDELKEMPSEINSPIYSYSGSGTPQGIINFKVERDEQDKILVKILKSLEENLNVLLYGPPGTGKTYYLMKIKEFFEREEKHLVFNKYSKGTYFSDNIFSYPSNLTKFVTFHQSYTYEEFIGGLRPQPKKNALLNLEPYDGVLKQLSSHAISDINYSSILLIDEINRGNVSKIFGEFITLMEPEKRLGKDNEKINTTIGVTLPMSATSSQNLNSEFLMPHKLYTMATMNSLDRSVMPLDSALRRRFEVIEFEPDLELLSKQLGFKSLSDVLNIDFSSVTNDVHKYKALAIKLLHTINIGIKLSLGKDFELGHSYFWNLNENEIDVLEDKLIQNWNQKIIPQLKEMFRGRDNELGIILGAMDFDGSPFTTLQSDYPFQIIQTQFNGIEYLDIRNISKSSLKHLERIASIDYSI